MALPLLATGAVIGATGAAAHALLKDPPTKEELARKKITADTLLVVRPKTFLQRTAVNIVNSLLF